MIKLPDDIAKLTAIKADLEKQEADIQKAKRLKEEIKVLLRKQEERKRWKKLERQQKIRRFFHLRPKTLIEAGLFSKSEEE